MSKHDEKLKKIIALGKREFEEEIFNTLIQMTDVLRKISYKLTNDQVRLIDKADLLIRCSESQRSNKEQ